MKKNALPVTGPLFTSSCVAFAQMFVGIYGLLGLAVAICIFADDIEAGALIGIVILIIFLGWMLYLGIKTAKIMRCANKYFEWLAANQPPYSIAQLASAMGKPVDIVRSNLQFIMKRKYFPNAHIDDERDLVVFMHPQKPSSISVPPSPVPMPIPPPVPVPPPPIPIPTPVPERQYAVVNCKGCGSPKQILVGTASECEYCGSPIQ